MASLIFKTIIPNIFSKLIGDRYDEKFARASCIHDFLIRIEHNINERDRIFYEVLLEDGVSKPKALVMYWAVKIYSFVYFIFYSENIEQNTCKTNISNFF